MAIAKEKNVVNKIIRAVYEKDSKRYYRYIVQENELGIVGTLYQPKDKKHVEEVTLQFDK
jgi:hypothetical protein